MKKPLPFIVEKEGKLALNEEVMNIIKSSINPRFILFYGKTRLWKSTILNQLIRGNSETWKFINKKPFDSCDSLNSVTKGCDIFRPIKIKELMKRHNLKKPTIKEYFDVFFCDTEGISSLNGIQKTTIPGILTLLQILQYLFLWCIKHVLLLMLKKFVPKFNYQEYFQKIYLQLQKLLFIFLVFLLEKRRRRRKKWWWRRRWRWYWNF